MMIFFALWMVSLAAPQAAISPPSAPAAIRSEDAPIAFARCGFRILAEYPHDRTAFTQGLFWHGGHLYESTGQYGQSRVARLDLKTGKALKVEPFSPRHFGEGITRWGDQIIGLTWQSGIGYRWRLKDLKPVGQFRFEGEGWGVTMVEGEMALSDGTPNLRFYDPATMEERRRVTVRLGGKPLARINELETMHGDIWANVWMTDAVVRIRPQDGAVTQLVDLSGLRAKAGAYGADAVLNGIAWDGEGKRLFVTGKNWPKLFQIDITDCR